MKKTKPKPVMIDRDGNAVSGHHRAISKSAVEKYAKQMKKGKCPKK